MAECPLCANGESSLETCELCGTVACCVCTHERDCCFRDAEARLASDAAWAPSGWRQAERLLDGSVEFVVIGGGDG